VMVLIPKETAMKIFQLHLKGQNRTEHNFKTEEEALIHQDRLIRYARDRILEGQLGFKSYMREAKELSVMEIDTLDRKETFAVCELTYLGHSAIKIFSQKDHAENFLNRMKQNSKRYFGIMECVTNA